MNKIQWKQHYREQRLINNEVWVDIKWYDGQYRISTLWRILSIKHQRKAKFLIPWIDKWWYQLVNLCYKNVCCTKKVHRLVAQAFLENPENKYSVNHINWIKTDNCLNNLEWNTSSENNKHAYLIGLKNNKNNHFIKNNPNRLKTWSKSHNAKKVVQLNTEWFIIAEFGSVVDASKSIWFHAMWISACLRGKQKTCGGYVWKYKL